MVTVRELLVSHFLTWQQETGEVKKQGEFADYIGEDEKYLSMVMNGRKASKRQIIHFADFFNDPRFYDAAGMDRPDPMLVYVRRNWPTLPEEEKKRIAEEVGRYSTEEVPDASE